MSYQIFNDDCLRILDRMIKHNVKVDFILTDPPYGTTNLDWDIPIPMSEMWDRLYAVLKPNGVICLFGAEPFSSKIRLSTKYYKYDIYWQKERPVNVLQLKHRYGNVIENIMVFYKKQPTYNPQMRKYNGKQVSNKVKGTFSSVIAVNKLKPKEYIDTGYRYPINVLRINRETKRDKCGFHPTQKPVELLKELILTFTNPTEIVLDFTMGSGSTGESCILNNRNFIGIEIDHKYFETADNRINTLLEQKRVNNES